MDWIKQILRNKKIYAWISGIILFFAIMLFLADKVLMPEYTNYNEGVTVPDVTKISLTEARQLLESYGLRYEVADRRAHSSYPADYIIDQTPGASQIVKPNRKVYLTVNTAVQPKAVVPNLVNMSFRNAKIQLENYGLSLGTTSYESSRFKNTVLWQSLTPRDTVPKGSVVDITISDGLGERMVEVPEIIGLRLPEAQQKLRGVGLSVSEIRFQPSKDTLPNTILNFSPKEKELREGKTLTLVVSERFDAREVSETGAVNVDTVSVSSPGNSSVTPPDTSNSEQ
ncbi:MAG TPA: PASTA domain-containing protein [Balneolaceae bacterium]|nr:PASTA domain-containing protein [Balneolaceae bacterium]